MKHTSWRQKIRHGVKNTSWRQKVSHDVKNTSWRQKFMTSKIHHDVKKFVMMSKTPHDIKKFVTTQKFIISSKIRHDFKKCVMTWKTRHDIKKHVLTSKSSSWRQKYIKKSSSLCQNTSKYVMLSKIRHNVITLKIFRHQFYISLMCRSGVINDYVFFTNSVTLTYSRDISPQYRYHTRLPPYTHRQPDRQKYTPALQ